MQRTLNCESKNALKQVSDSLAAKSTIFHQFSIELLDNPSVFANQKIWTLDSVGRFKPPYLEQQVAKYTSTDVFYDADFLQFWNSISMLDSPKRGKNVMRIDISRDSNLPF